MPNPSTLNAISSHIGREIYEEFQTTVILREQKRIHDPIWHDFLRFGHVRSRHLEMLHVQNNPQDDYSTTPWDNAVLITPRHGVRT
jgi:hypothetical protein